MSKRAKKPANKIVKKRAAKPRLLRALAVRPLLPTKATASKDEKPALERISKQSRVIDLLRSPDGTTIASVMKSTGWQQHSVRGFLAGVVRKKLGLKLSSETKEGIRHYRILGGQSGDTSSSMRKRAR